MVKINNDYGYGSDTYNFILFKSRIIKDENSERFGKEVWEGIGYYSSLKNLIFALMKHVARDEIEDLARLESKLEDLYKSLEKVIREKSIEDAPD